MDCYVKAQKHECSAQIYEYLIKVLTPRVSIHPLVSLPFTQLSLPLKRELSETVK